MCVWCWYLGTMVWQVCVVLVYWEGDVKCHMGVCCVGVVGGWCVCMRVCAVVGIC